MKLHYIAGASALMFVCGMANALSVKYSAYVDDYAVFKIDGEIIMSYDDYPAGTIHSEMLDLAQGWHQIDIVYQNRWGSNSLRFYDEAMTVLPLERFQSLDAQGNQIAGLRADYYTLNSSFVKTVYGEGPIYHGWCAEGTGVFYQGVTSDPWGGIYNGWDKFEERLTGKIYVGELGESSVPAPAAALPMALGLFGAALNKRRKTR